MYSFHLFVRISRVNCIDKLDDRPPAEDTMTDDQVYLARPLFFQHFCGSSNMTRSIRAASR